MNGRENSLNLKVKTNVKLSLCLTKNATVKTTIS